jgi:hypothetical protein
MSTRFERRQRRLAAKYRSAMEALSDVYRSLAEHKAGPFLQRREARLLAAATDLAEVVTELALSYRPPQRNRRRPV